MFRGKHALVPAVLCLLGLCMPLPSRAGQERNQAVIRSVSVLVDGQPASPEMRELVPVKKGDPFSLKGISDSIRKIYKSGLFSDVRVVKQGESLDLSYLMSKRFFTRKIIFFGSRDIPRAKLNEGLYSLDGGSPFSESRLSKAVDELKAVLQREGYLHADIKTIIQKDPTVSQIDILFEIITGKRYRINRIIFKGDILAKESEIAKKMQLRQGQEFIPVLLEKDIERIKDYYHSLNYRQVEIMVEDEVFNDRAGTMEFALHIIPKEKIEIDVRGADVPLDLIRPIWDVRVFEEWGLAQGESKIAAFLRKKGYLFPHIKSSIKKEGPTVKIIHEVKQGKRYRLGNVLFRGLHYFSSSRIKLELGIRSNIPLLARIDGARLFDLPGEIKFMYKNSGFPDTQVELNFELEGKKARPVFDIEEGKQNKVKDVQFEGPVMFTEKDLISQISSRPGGPFFQPNIQKDIEELETFYANRGVRGTTVRAFVQASGGSLYSIRFTVDEGRLVRIGRIVLNGNKVTRKKTILREIMLKSGDYARYDAIQESKRRLEKLGIFSEVHIEEIALSENSENLLIRVLEGQRNYAGLGLGLETVREPDSFALWNNQFRLRGTAEFIRSNVFGTASQISAVGQVSLREQRVVLSWEQPYFFGLPIESFLNGWIEREVRKSYSFDRRSVSLTGIKFLSASGNMTLSGALRLARTTLYKLDIPESGVDRQHFPYSATSISSTFLWDKRNDPFNPSRGFFLSSVVEWAYPLFHAESNYLKIFSKYQHYVSILPGLVFSSTTRIGLGRGRIPIHERFFGGGSNSFRGVAFDELGPQDLDSQKPVGGKALMIFNFELTFPLLSSLKALSGAVFYDKGNVFENRRNVSWVGLQDAVGFGLRYRTPLGPIRLELGWNLDAPKGQKRAKAYVTIGNIF